MSEISMILYTILNNIFCANGKTNKKGGRKMIEQDTIRLLREVDAGVKMGVSSIDEVLGRVKSQKLVSFLNDCRIEHERLRELCEKMLNEYGDEGKDTNPIASGMSKIKTEFKLAVNETDEAIADIMTDGCNMGIKSLNKYLNEYEAAEERAKDIAKKLIKLEEKLAKEMKFYL